MPLWVQPAARLLMQGFGNHLLDHRIANSAWRAGARFIKQSLKSSALKAPAPLAHRLPYDAQLPRYLSIGAILLTGQHNPRTQREGLRCLVPSRPLAFDFRIFIGAAKRIRTPDTRITKFLLECSPLANP